MPQEPFALGRPMLGDTFGPYRILRELGAGRSGIVFLAERTLPGSASGARHIALKVLRPQRIASRRGADRFLRTVALASRLESPNVCPIEGGGTHHGIPWLALRYIEGATMQSLVAAAGSGQPPGPLDRAEFDDILQQFEKLGRALHRLHRNGITHRDVKPSNILIDPAGEPWLLDFGLVHVAGLDLAAEGPAGSPAYMAPELLRGSGAAGASTDLYALGVTLFERLTGRVPYDATTIPGLLQAVAAEARPRARQSQPGLPVEIDVVLDRVLAARPADRLRTAEQFAEDLRRIRCRLPLSSRPLARHRKLARWLRRNPLLATAMVAMAVCLAVVGVGFAQVVELRDQAELLAARAEIEAARRVAGRWLPARPDVRSEIEQWLRRQDGPDGLSERLRRVRAERARLQQLARVEAGADIANRAELEAELRELEQLPRWLQVAAGLHGPARALPALVPSIERHRSGIEAALVASRGPRFVWADAMTQRYHAQLAATETELERELGAEGIMARMSAELAVLDAVAAAEQGLAAAWRDAVRFHSEAPAYAGDLAAGFRLEPIHGLQPLPPDPVSGLLEFAWLRSGNSPERSLDGRLVVRAATAIVFVLMPGGTFRMGATSEPGGPDSHFAALPDESPVTAVTLAPFLLSKFEVTQAQWRRMGGRQAAILRSGDRIGDQTIGDTHPVEGVTFREVELVLAQNGLCLPTEAQWELAAHRSGLREPFGVAANLRDAADGFPMSHAPVGSFPADRCGLHDLFGNVAEMVADRYGNYDLAVPRPGDGLRSGWRVERMTRGGGFFSEPTEARVTRRSAIPDFGVLPFVGVRPSLIWPRR
ncbi:MAG: SUMF1/EgtB/PvdO family nonheme iron enzyme [Planctomycetes bacterium]|nr:SUMF1/EgtB/PvdO family nonheme iron enzyme [Planctomycetota bacterium]